MMAYLIIYRINKVAMLAQLIDMGLNGIWLAHKVVMCTYLGRSQPLDITTYC